MASFIYSTAGMILILVSTCSANFEFIITYQNSTKTGLVCRYGNETEKHYFDVFRNGRQCLTAAYGACALVVNRGCRCGEKMKQNEIRFTINSPKDYDTLQCKVLDKVSKEKTINVTANAGTPKTSANKSPPATPMPTTKVNDEKPGHGTKTVRQDFKVRILTGLACALLVFVVGVGILVFACRVKKCSLPEQEITLHQARDESRSSNSQDMEKKRRTHSL